MELNKKFLKFLIIFLTTLLNGTKCYDKHNNYSYQQSKHNINNNNVNSSNNNDELLINRNNLNDLTRISHHNHHNRNYRENFILTDYLLDGEYEKRISYNGITAIETTVGFNSSNSLSLQQISNGKHLMQLIYGPSSELMDCEYIRRKDIVENFLDRFHSQYKLMKSRNFTSMINVPTIRAPIISNHEFNRFIEDNIIPDDYYDLQNKIPIDDMFSAGRISYKIINNYNELPEYIRIMVNYYDLKEKCNKLNQQLKQIAIDLNSQNEMKKFTATEHFSRRKRSISNLLIAPNTKWCGRGQNAASYNDLGGASRADKCCRKHDYCKANIQAMSTKWHLFNYRPYTITHCSCDTRHRRDISHLLRIPGTRWCGKGWSAKKYSDLGGYSKADRCCRQHDKSCPFWIMGFQTKYGLFNFRVNTLMHCKCDERFRTCLKMADSADANMIGKLFFNIVQTKCFVLKPEKVCKMRNEDDKCIKKALRKRAYLRDNRKF